MVTNPTFVTKQRSASETKLDAFGIDMQEFQGSLKSQLVILMNAILCPMCKQCCLTFVIPSGKWGLATEARLVCEV